MKKLIEFQEVKHSEVIDIINKFRADTGVTFSEAVRRLILVSQNGCDPGTPESVIYTTGDKRVDELEEKVETLIKVSKLFKKHMEGETDGQE